MRRLLLVLILLGPVLLVGTFLLLTRGRVESSIPLQEGVVVRCISESIRPAEDGHGLILLEGEPVEILIESRQPLAAVRLDFESRATSFLTLDEGWRLGERLFRPDASIVFSLTPERQPERYRPFSAPWRRGYRYRLGFQLPGGSRNTAIGLELEAILRDQSEKQG